MRLSKKHKKLITNLIFLGITVFILFLLLEGSFRLFNTCSLDSKRAGNLFSFIQESDNPSLIFELKPNAGGYLSEQYVRINSLGFRGPEYSISKSDDVFRVIVLGESITFGWGVSENETFQEVLSKNLEEELDKEVEVFNLGVPGYVGSQIQEVLFNAGEIYDSDIIIVGYFLDYPNEPWNLLETSSRLPPSIKTFLGRTSCTYNWLRDKKSDFVVKNRSADTTTPYKEHYLPESEAWVAQVERFEELGAYSINMEVPIVVVLLPNWEDLDENYPYKNEHAFLVETINNSGLYYIDMFPIVEGLNPEEYRINKAVHPNARGNSLIGDTIYFYLKEQKLLPENNFFLSRTPSSRLFIF